MLKKANQKITRYEYESVYGLYYVDIIETETEYEAWITGERSGLSSLMFGLLKEQNARKEFMSIVEVLLDEYIEDWEEELLDIEDMNCEKLFAEEGK